MILNKNLYKKINSFFYKKNKGVTLFSLIISIAILIGITISGMWLKVEKLRQIKAEEQAKILKQLGEGLNKYIIENKFALLNNDNISNVNNKYAPTFNELQNLKYIPDTLSQQNLYNGNYITVIRMRPVGCTPTGENANCNLEGIVALTSQMTQNGVNSIFIDYEKLAGYATKKIGTPAGFSTRNTPNIITGFNGDWEFENPNGNIAGILAVRTDYISSTLSKFLRRDGTVSMNGNLDMNNHDINNIKNQINNSNANFNNIITNGNATIKGVTNFYDRVFFNGLNDSIFDQNVKFNNAIKFANVQTAGAPCNEAKDTLAINNQNITMLCYKGIWRLLVFPSDWLHIPPQIEGLYNAFLGEVKKLIKNALPMTVDACSVSLNNTATATPIPPGKDHVDPGINRNPGGFFWGCNPPILNNPFPNLSIDINDSYSVSFGNTGAGLRHDVEGTIYLPELKNHYSTEVKFTCTYISLINTLGNWIETHIFTDSNGNVHSQDYLMSKHMEFMEGWNHGLHKFTTCTNPTFTVSQTKPTYSPKIYPNFF